MMTRTNSKGPHTADSVFERVLCRLDRLWMKTACNVILLGPE